MRLDPGEIWAKKDICVKCNGKKLSQERKILDVHVDKGMRNDQKVGRGSRPRTGHSRLHPLPVTRYPLGPNG